ncbi:MAG: response regulator [Phycisphaerales bacterium]|nr:response regulator [Phycisphaerales bacterium]
MSNFTNSAAEGPCVVLVDDEPHITHMVARKLMQCGYTVHTAMDGQQGLELILEVMPDLVVTDLQMPYMSGIELSARLWESEKTKDIPVIMLTARGFAIEDQVRELGNIRSLLSKPFGTKALIELIGSTLSSDGGVEGMCA